MAILRRDGIDLPEQSVDPTVPSAGTVNLYADANGLVSQLPSGTKAAHEGQIFEEQMTLWGVYSTDIVSGARNFFSLAQSPQIHRTSSYINGSIPGIRYGWILSLGAGDYQATVIGVEFADGGVIKLYADGIAVGNQSMYNAAVVYNTEYNFYFSLGESRAHTLEIEVLGVGVNAGENAIAAITKMRVKKL